MGAVGLAWWVAIAAFVVLLVHGTFVAEAISGRGAVVWAVAGALVFLGLPYAGASDWRIPVFAILDIALVLVIFKGDVRL